MVDQSEPMGVLGLYRFAREQVLVGEPQRHQPRQALGAAAAGQMVERDLGLAEPGAFDRDPDVAGHGDLGPAAIGKAVDRADHRFRRVFDSLQPGLPDLHELITAERREALHLLHVAAGRKGDVAGAGQYDDPGAVVAAEVTDGILDQPHGLCIDGVARFGPVDDQRRDVAFGYAQQLGIAHVVRPFLKRFPQRRACRGARP